MPEGYPATDEQTTAEVQEDFNVSAFLGELGIAELFDSPIRDHAGNITTLGRAVAECTPARDALTSVKETLQEIGVEDIAGAMKKHVAKMAPPPESEILKKN